MNCGSCKWFVSAAGDYLECDDVDGVCMRYPPACGYDNGAFWLASPEVARSGGCGEFVFTARPTRLTDRPRTGLRLVRGKKEAG